MRCAVPSFRPAPLSATPHVLLPKLSLPRIAADFPLLTNVHAASRVLQELLPRLRVLARSSPEDKLTLVRLLKKNGEVVAVTGEARTTLPRSKSRTSGLRWESQVGRCGVGKLNIVELGIDTGTNGQNQADLADQSSE